MKPTDVMQRIDDGLPPKLSARMACEQVPKWDDARLRETRHQQCLQGDDLKRCVAGVRRRVTQWRVAQGRWR